MKTTWMSCLTAVGLLGSLSAACSANSEQTDSDRAASTRAVACTPDQQLSAYAHMIEQPIVPPRMFAGIDLANGDDWKGLAFEDAEQTLCQGNPIAGKDEGVESAGWGIAPNYQVVVEYDKTTHAINFYQLNAGYKGTLDFASRPSALGDPTKPNPFGHHTYSIGVGSSILRDAKPWALDWQNFDAQSTELFDALMFTFAPELPSTQGSCRAEGLCLARTLESNDAVFGARPLGIYFHVADSAAAPNTPDYLYGFPVKVLPFSGAEMTLKLDAEGPVATASGLGDHGSNCTMKLGTPLQSFLGDCVQVLSDPAKNELLAKKALGNAKRVVTSSGSAATGTWILDEAGVHPNFESERFDETAPAKTARATEITLDVRASGKIKNEYSADGTHMTLAGTAAVYAEYARTVQDFLHAKMDPSLPQFPVGDPHCLLPAGADPSTWAPARGCTGMEQFFTPTASERLGITTALKPGEPMAFFCADPGVFEHCGDPICDDSGNTCSDDKLGFNSPLWDGTRARVIAVLGGGNESAVPAEARDTKTYVLLWTKALVKYLRAAPQSPADLSNPAFDALTPSDGDITIETVHDDVVKVKYLNKFEMQLAYTAGAVQSITFR
jgi:hypothetical protein